MTDLEQLGKLSKKASITLQTVSDEKINQTLIKCASLLRENAEYLKAQNAIDVANAKSVGKSEGFIDRLLLTDKVIEGVAQGIEQVATLKSPVGDVVYNYENVEQGISVKKLNVPFGVIGIIYEARPNVTGDAFALCFKTSNAVILKGGSDAINSNKAIVSLIRQGLEENGIDKNAVTLIEDTSRQTTERFMKLNKYVDLLIPRGGASLIRSAVENSTIPIIETGTGNCHVYVDEFASVNKAVEIIFNAKTQRYSVCNACESLVFHEKVVEQILPMVYDKLRTKEVELRCDEISYKILNGKDGVVKATEEDFYTEYGGPIISVKVVSDLSSAIDYINEHSTKHSESIVTEKVENAEEFLKKIDSSSVYHNASTRFTDGFVFGLGAEIGISTQKLHARGPMGLSALVTQKYVIKGDGAVRK